MRPVNLIPPEERRGDQAPLRTGPLAYIVLGALVALLAGVAVLVLTGNQVSERENQLATLEREDAAAAAKAARLASYTQFRALSEQRVQTVQSLADSRFDWERVLRELALILPSDVSLSDLSANGAGATGGGEESAGFSGVSGPSMQLNGCAAGHGGVAGFVTALKDIDGVTRVGVQSSQDSSEEGGSGGGEGGECAIGGSTTTFAITVAFDAAPVPVAEAAPEAAPASSEGEGSEEEEAEEGG